MRRRLVGDSYRRAGENQRPGAVLPEQQDEESKKAETANHSVQGVSGLTSTCN
jgi:hypothetical protein